MTGQFIDKLNPAQLQAVIRTAEGILDKLRPGESVDLPADLGWVKQTGPKSYLVQGPTDRKAFRTRSEARGQIATIIARSELAGG